MKTKSSLTRVYVSYLGSLNMALDNKIEKLAKEYGGERTGAGSGFGGRDIDFEFKGKKDAESFIEKVKVTFLKVKPFICET